jgi:hypothetical protein
VSARSTEKQLSTNLEEAVQAGTVDEDIGRIGDYKAPGILEYVRRIPKTSIDRERRRRDRRRLEVRRFGLNESSVYVLRVQERILV